MNEQHQHYINNRVLKLQVGFLLNENVGYVREIPFDVPDLLVSDDLKLGHLRGRLKLTRTTRGILIQGTLDATVQSECSRCLDPTEVSLQLQLEELYVSPPEPNELFTVPEAGLIDLAPLIREEAIVQIPITILCRPNCAGLCINCGANLNYEVCQCEADPIDPRLAALKDLRDQLDKDS